jgi:hypothetical protein
VFHFACGVCLRSDHLFPPIPWLSFFSPFSRHHSQIFPLCGFLFLLYLWCVCVLFVLSPPPTHTNAAPFLRSRLLLSNMSTKQKMDRIRARARAKLKNIQGGVNVGVNGDLSRAQNPLSVHPDRAELNPLCAHVRVAVSCVSLSWYLPSHVLQPLCVAVSHRSLICVC